MKKMMAALMLLLLLLSTSALAEECVLCSGDGVCDLCSGKGFLLQDIACVCNGGKCNKCDAAEKKADISERKFAISAKLIADKGRYTLKWQDTANAGPYKVLRTYHNSATVIEQTDTYANGNEEASTSYRKELTINFLIPGEKYAFTVIDKNGEKVTKVIEVPKAKEFKDGKLKAESVDISLKPVAYYTTDGHIKKLGEHQAKTMMSYMRKGHYVGLEYTIEFPRLAKDREFFTQIVFYAPNGYSYTEYGQTDTYRCFSNASGSYMKWKVMGEDFFSNLFETTGSVPKGEYIVELYWDGMHVNKSTFMVY